MVRPVARESGPSFSIVICTRNRTDSLRETLACIVGSGGAGPGGEVLVVDNGKHPATL